MNTAALLPSPAATARPSRGGIAEAADAAAPDDAFAGLLVSSLDAGAEAPLPLPLPVLESLPEPFSGEPAEVAAAAVDGGVTTDGTDAAPLPGAPLDPQLAYALAALGLLAATPAAAVPVAAPALPGTSDGAGEAPADADVALPAAAPVVRAAVTPAALPPTATPASAMPAQPPVAAAGQPSAPGAPQLPLAETNEAPDANGAVERTTLKAERAAGSEQPVAAVGSTPLRAPGVAAAPVQAVLALKGEATQWQQPLLQALGDRLQLQIATRSDQAVIRLQPPMLGQVEIAIRQQAGDLQVRIAASNDEVTRQIQQVGEQLRQSLVQRHSGEVSVQVAQPGAAGREADARGGAQQQQAARDGQQQARDEQQQQRRPGRGLDGGDAAGFSADLAAMNA